MMIVLLALAQTWAATGVASPYPYVQCLTKHVAEAQINTQSPAGMVDAAERACATQRDATMKRMASGMWEQIYLTTGQVDGRTDEERMAVAEADVRNLLMRIIDERKPAS